MPNRSFIYPLILFDIIKGVIDHPLYEVEITYHVYLQARKRGISYILIEHTLRHGVMHHYGKHGVRFIAKGKRTIICVGQIVGTKLTIFTIEVA